MVLPAISPIGDSNIVTFFGSPRQAVIPLTDRGWACYMERMPEAAFAHDFPEFSECRLCPNRCRMAENRRGRCLGRGRQGGRTVLHNFGRVAAAHVDPIEKKPLYHFFPGRPILSVGTFGCNLTCRFCQNHDLSQQEVPADVVPPERLADWAAEIPGNLGVAFTYNEPGIWFEYVMATAPLLQDRGLATVLVTNGYLEEEPWRELCRVTAAMNIDLKGFSEDFYREVCGGHLDPVRRNIAIAVAAGVHVEVTTLVVPGLNDDEGVFRALIDWLADLSPKIPFHLSRYFPRFKETSPPTPPALLRDVARLARQRLSYVFLGNLPEESDQSTRCPACGAVWIERHGYQVRRTLTSRVCGCGESIPIVGWSA
jgi:pyruvate formate lyase activating enzyme